MHCLGRSENSAKWNKWGKVSFLSIFFNSNSVNEKQKPKKKKKNRKSPVIGHYIEANIGRINISKKHFFSLQV